jgi:MOSC domain-containing protein YiiM
MQLLSVNTGSARPLRIGSRSFLSAIGKSAVAGPVAVGRLGLHGDEQADPSVHGGLDKAVYAYPSEHLAFWQAQRRAHGVTLFDEVLPPGFVGENLSLAGLLEREVWIGDTLHFPGCVLRVTAPREPCFKFNAVMGLSQAGRLMMQHACPGFYLAVVQPGPIEAGQAFALVPGVRGLSVLDAFAAKRIKHLR